MSMRAEAIPHAEPLPGLTVQGAHHPTDARSLSCRDHYVLDAPFEHAGHGAPFQRIAGDPLCRPRDQFARLGEPHGDGKLPSCTGCVRFAIRYGFVTEARLPLDVPSHRPMRGDTWWNLVLVLAPGVVRVECTSAAWKCVPTAPPPHLPSSLRLATMISPIIGYKVAYARLGDILPAGPGKWTCQIDLRRALF